MLRVFLVIDDYNELIYLQTLLKKLGFDVEGLQNQKKYADLSLGFNPHLLLATAKGKKVDGLALARSVHKRRGLPKIVALINADQDLNQTTCDELGIDYVLQSPINPKRLIQAVAHLGDLDETALMEKYSKIKGLVQTDDKENSRSLNLDDNGQPIEDLKVVKSAIDTITGKATVIHGERKEASTAVVIPGSGKSERVTVRGESTMPSKEDSAGGEIESAAGSDDETARDATSPLLQNTPGRQDRFTKWTNALGPLPTKNFDRERIKEFNKKIRSAPPPDDIGDIEDERKRFVKALFKK